MQFNDQGIRGFDVSFWQDDNSTPQKVDFKKMKAWGAHFVIIRAGQNAWVDEDFAYNWQAAKEAGLPRAAYWFFDPRYSPVEQGRLFANCVAQDKPEGRLWADLEFPTAWGGNYMNWTHWRTFMEEAKARSGLRMGVYTAQWWWKPNAVDRGADLNYFGQHPLWVAQYVGDPFYVTLPKPWMQAMLWQDGTPAIGRQVGAESEEIDHNRWNSDFDFASEWGGATVPPPSGGMMKKGIIHNGITLNVRSGVGTSHPILTTVTGGDAVIGNLDSASNWLNVLRIERKAGAVETINGWCSAHSSYMSLADYVPPSDALPTLTVTVQGDGYKTVSVELEPL